MCQKHRNWHFLQPMPLVHVSPAPSPLRLVTFEYPGTTTVLFRLNLSFHIKQSLMPTKKKGKFQASQKKKPYLSHLHIICPLEKGWSSQQLRQKVRFKKKWPVTATSPPSAKRPLGHLDRLPVAPGSSHWPISIWPKLRVQAYHLSEVVSTGEKKIKMEHFFQIGWFQGDKMIKRETTWDRPKIVGSPPNLWQALKLHGLACRSHELVLCNEGRGDVIEKCLTQHKWIKTD